MTVDAGAQPGTQPGPGAPGPGRSDAGRSGVGRSDTGSAGGPPPQPRRRSRRDEILQIAVRLFAAKGYHGVSMDDIGSAAGVTGPALYHHFAGKEAMLVAALVPVSDGLLSRGRARVDAHRDDPAAALRALVDFHVSFALDDPAVISLHLHELDRLPEEPRREIRRLQRQYVEVWVDVINGVHPRLARDEARVLAHAAFGLINSTPFIGPEVERNRRAALLRASALAALNPAKDALVEPTLGDSANTVDERP